MSRRVWVVAGAGLIALGVAIGLAVQIPIVSSLRDVAARSWSNEDLLIVGGVLLAVIATIAGTVFPTRYLPTVWALAPLAPGLAAVTVVATDLVRPPGDPATTFFIGVEIATAILILGAIPLRVLATVRVAQTRSYWELRRRSEQLEGRLATIVKSGPRAEAGDAHGTWSTTEQMAIDEATDQLAAVHRALFTTASESRTSGLEWVSAMGYVSLWRRIDRADEALIEVEPCEVAVADALHDLLRLAGSDIKRDQLQPALLSAVKVLDADALKRYFAVSSNGLPAVPDDPPTAGDRCDSEGSARAVLREVRFAVNTYLEDKMESIVRARNRLWRVILLTATTTFLLVGLAVLNEVPKANLIAVSVFFLVAATVGLFNRLRLQATADSAVEDFNLFEARLVHTPLISGLAGVAGVFAVAMAPAVSGQQLDKGLSDIFDLGTNLLGVIVAAGFGLAPDRIIGPLQDQTERLKSQLKAGKAAVETGGPTGAAGGTGGQPEGST
jgi:hypothetical protein